MVNIIQGSRELRLLHWKDIQSRVTTHEGEFLAGSKGADYQRKHSKKLRGKDLNTKPLTIVDVERAEKTKSA